MTPGIRRWLISAGCQSRAKGNSTWWASLELAAQAGKEEGQQQQQEDEQIQNPKLFCADHPSIVLVRDNATGSLLLMGALDQVDGEALHDEL